MCDATSVPSPASAAGALPNPRELEPVLARLREAVITEYGEQVRSAIQRLEADEIAKAW